MKKFIYPDYFLIVRRTAENWRIRIPNKVFWRPENCPLPIDLERREEAYGLTVKEIIIELFRINGGKLGYYLANMRSRQYYYCGQEISDVREKLLDLGIGRREPMEGKR